MMLDGLDLPPVTPLGSQAPWGIMLDHGGGSAGPDRTTRNVLQGSCRRLNFLFRLPTPYAAINRRHTLEEARHVLRTFRADSFMSRLPGTSMKEAACIFMSLCEDVVAGQGFGWQYI